MMIITAITMLRCILLVLLWLIWWVGVGVEVEVWLMRVGEGDWWYSLLSFRWWGDDGVI